MFLNIVVPNNESDFWKQNWFIIQPCLPVTLLTLHVKWRSQSLSKKIEISTRSASDGTFWGDFGWSDVNISKNGDTTLLTQRLIGQSSQCWLQPLGDIGDKYKYGQTWHFRPSVIFWNSTFVGCSTGSRARAPCARPPQSVSPLVSLADDLEACRTSAGPKLAFDPSRLAVLLLLLATLLCWGGRRPAAEQFSRQVGASPEVTSSKWIALTSIYSNWSFRGFFFCSLMLILCCLYCWLVFCSVVPPRWLFSTEYSSGWGSFSRLV